MMVAALGWLWSGLPVHAQLSFEIARFEDFSIVIVSGAFEANDDLQPFLAAVRESGASAATFRSPGGNLAKSMELGRLIRLSRLMTIQTAKGECESACALAFMGGVARFADPGSIGMHRSSFSGGRDFAVDDAVSAVQQATAETMIYMGEMGVDPTLLQLALQYDAGDMRYLSLSEMRRYGVVTVDASLTESSAIRSDPSASAPRPSAQAPAPLGNQPDLSIPFARTGRAQHPSGFVELRLQPEPKATITGRLANGTAVRIIDTRGQWYRVSAGQKEGYAHAATVAVDQFDGLGFGERTIQVKSVRSLREARDYVVAASIPLAAYVTTSGWFAITTRESFIDKEVGLATLRQLKGRALVPSDSVLTFGNTYVRRVCCRQE